MKPIRIFRHIDCEGPGYLLDVLARYDVPHELVAIDQGDEVPAGIDDISGLVIMGGSMSANDELPWIKQEMQLVRLASEKGMPILGHCLGGQIMAKALGAEVVKNRVEEIGWFNVRKGRNTSSQKWLSDLPQEMMLYHWHGEMFELPEGAECILENDNCPHQGFVRDNMLALQCHIEMTEALVTEWAMRFAEQITPGGPTVNNPERMLQGLPQRIRDLNGIADKIYTRWLQPIMNNA